jgi:hypothetical protein
MRLVALEEWFRMKLHDRHGDYINKIDQMVKKRLVNEINLWLIPEEHREKFKWCRIVYAGWHMWKNKNTQLIKVHLYDVSDNALKKHMSQDITMATALVSTSRICVIKVIYEHGIVPRIKDVSEITVD